MNKPVERPMLASIRGTMLPNPEYFGLKWREAQKLLEEHHKLRDQGRRIDRERQETKEEIKRLEGELRQQRALALRGGPEPDEKPLETAKARLATFNGRVEDLRRAGDMVAEGLRRAVEDNHEKWTLAGREEAKRCLRSPRDAPPRARCSGLRPRRVRAAGGVACGSGAHLCGWTGAGACGMREDLGQLTGRGLGHLTDEDFQRTEPIADGSAQRRLGENILAAVDASNKGRQGPDPVLEALARGYQARKKEERT